MSSFVANLLTSLAFIGENKFFVYTQMLLLSNFLYVHICMFIFLAFTTFGHYASGSRLASVCGTTGILRNGN